MWIGRRRASTSKRAKGRGSCRLTHTWRTRSDPLEKVWPEVAAMLRDAPELEAKTLFDHFRVRPESGLEETSLADLLPAGAALAGDRRSGAGSVLRPGATSRARCCNWTGPTRRSCG